MKLETFKSILLVLLIGLSLMLTFGLWNYKSDFEQLETGKNYASEVSVGGKEERRNNLIAPSSIIFRIDDEHFGYKDPQQEETFFHDMQSWVMTDFTMRESSSRGIKDYDIEVIFPDALPIEIASSLFSFANVDEIKANWSFDRIYLKLEEDTATISIFFPSIDKRQLATASLNVAVTYNGLEDLLTSRKGLTEYLLIDKGTRDIDDDIYVRNNTKGIEKRSLIVSKISPDSFVEVLFPDPTLISRSNKGNTNSGEYYYADSTREMRIRQKETKLEFYNPNSTENAAGDIGPIELIDLSISRINSHKGWFDDYKLYELDTTNKSVTYQMQYNGYPVHNTNGLTFIETEYEGQDIYRYSRSLLSLGREVQTEQVAVPSGAKIIAHLMDNLNDPVDIKDIENIQLGYDFQYQEDNSVILEPAWFMQVNGVWKKILF